PGAGELQAHRQDAAREAQQAERGLGRVPGIAARPAAEHGAPGAAAGGEKAPVSRTTPGLLRRLASMVYEAVLLFAVGFFAAWLFFFASGGRDATAGAERHLLQLFIGLVFAAYFLWSWLRGGQTLAMKAWRIRLVDVTPARALLRFVLAMLL